MDIITHQQLRHLIEACKPPCVSIFMPTHREREVRQDPARLKNLIRQAEEKLIAHKMRPTLARDLLEPARHLLDDPNFWVKNDHGLAIYLCEGYHQILRVPINVPETTLVNDRFDIKPLLPLLKDRAFYILGLSHNDVRVLECTRHSCRKVDLPVDVAKNIREAIKPGDGFESETTRYAGNVTIPGSIAGGFHGQTPDNQQKILEDRLFFYRQIDEGFRRIVKDPNAILVLAGADSTVPYYRQAAEYKPICEEWIHGNPEHVDNEALHQKAIAILEPIWRKQLSELQEQYGTAYAHKLASNNINQIVPAAAQGQVGILFVAPLNQHLGKFDQEHQIVDDRSDEEDLIDVAAFETLMTGGQLVVVNPDQVPGNSEVAAIYRYMA